MSTFGNKSIEAEFVVVDEAYNSRSIIRLWIISELKLLKNLDVKTKKKIAIKWTKTSSLKRIVMCLKV